LSSDPTPLDRALARLADGDRAAFDPVYAAAWPVVRRFVGGLCSAEDADDAAQQALIKVFERASEYDAERPALPWILGIAGWEVRTLRTRRRRRREETPDLLDRLASGGADPEHHAAMTELDRLLDALIDGLRPDDRATIRAVLGQAPRPTVPAATFRKRVQRAMGRLRSAWKEQHGER